MAWRPTDVLPVRGAPCPTLTDDAHAPLADRARWLAIACAADATEAEIVAAQAAVMLDCIGHMHGAQHLANAGKPRLAVKHRVEKGMVADQLARRIGEALE